VDGDCRQIGDADIRVPAFDRDTRRGWFRVAVLADDAHDTNPARIPRSSTHSTGGVEWVGMSETVRRLATWEDPARTPDDGRVYEILDGELEAVD
jgi:hypothetical protein